jgi:hypothetical protein
MIASPIAFGIAVFLTLVTVAPRRPDFGVKGKDYLPRVLGVFLTATFAVVAISER